MDGKNTNQMVKLFTQGRHNNCDVIFANHYINNLHIQMKSHITDYALWAPISPSKLETFYKELCADNLDCTAKGHEFGYDKFLTQFNTQV